MIIKQQKLRTMKDNHVSFLSFSPTFSSNSELIYQSFENNQVAGGRRGCRRPVRDGDSWDEGKTRGCAVVAVPFQLRVRMTVNSVLKRTRWKNAGYEMWAGQDKKNGFALLINTFFEAFQLKILSLEVFLGCQQLNAYKVWVEIL